MSGSEKALRGALELIAALGDKTILGPEWDNERQHEIGAAKAFQQAADIAKDALSKALASLEAENAARWEPLWLTLNGLDKANASEQADAFMFTVLEGTRVGDGTRIQIRDALVDQLLAAEARGRLAAETAAPSPAQGEDQPRNAWRGIETAPKDWSRLLLGWQATEGLVAHVEFGRWKGQLGWCDIYGHPFSDDPDYFMQLPAPPALRAPRDSAPDRDKIDADLMHGLADERRQYLEAKKTDGAPRDNESDPDGDEIPHPHPPEDLPLLRKNP